MKIEILQPRSNIAKKITSFYSKAGELHIGDWQDEERDFTPTIEHYQCSTDPGTRTRVALLLRNTDHVPTRVIWQNGDDGISSVDNILDFQGKAEPVGGDRGVK